MLNHERVLSRVSVFAGNVGDDGAQWLDGVRRACSFYHVPESRDLVELVRFKLTAHAATWFRWADDDGEFFDYDSDGAPVLSWPRFQESFLAKFRGPTLDDSAWLALDVLHCENNSSRALQSYMEEFQRLLEHIPRSNLGAWETKQKFWKGLTKEQRADVRELKRDPSKKWWHLRDCLWELTMAVDPDPRLLRRHQSDVQRAVAAVQPQSPAAVQPQSPAAVAATSHSTSGFRLATCFWCGAVGHPAARCSAPSALPAGQTAYNDFCGRWRRRARQNRLPTINWGVDHAGQPRQCPWPEPTN
jgi:hypothetical protein